jgi:Rrf2 family transcriptional regulator, nitric oxide-sensitive transcriptional repressor
MISQTAEYALRAMSWMALTPDDRVPSSLLAEKTQVPSDYLSKVLQLLSEAGMIEGRRGVRGGYRLSKKPNKIKLLDIINAVSRDEMQLKRIESCPLGLSNHAPHLCPLHHTMDRAIEALIDVLGDMTIADMVDSDRDVKPLCDAEITAKLTISKR